MKLGFFASMLKKDTFIRLTVYSEYSVNTWETTAGNIVKNKNTAECVVDEYRSLYPASGFSITATDFQR